MKFGFTLHEAKSHDVFFLDVAHCFMISEGTSSCSFPKVFSGIPQNNTKIAFHYSQINFADHSLLPRQ
jgi:hypothetical protein